MGVNATGLGLAACAAITIAQSEAGSKELLSLAARVGFAAGADHANTGGLAANLQPFFLMHYAIGDTTKAHLLQSLRQSAATPVQYAPVVLIMPDGPYEVTIKYIQMGFDDVISLPEKSKVLSSRLAAQIGQERLYIETADYLGPDRRRMDLALSENPKRKQGGSKHTRVTFVREPWQGIKIVRLQLVLRAPVEAGPAPSSRNAEMLVSRDAVG